MIAGKNHGRGVRPLLNGGSKDNDPVSQEQYSDEKPYRKHVLMPAHKRANLTDDVVRSGLIDRIVTSVKTMSSASEAGLIRSVAGVLGV
jgi:hypothetical protein